VHLASCARWWTAPQIAGKATAATQLAIGSFELHRRTAEGALDPKPIQVVVVGMVNATSEGMTTHVETEAETIVASGTGTRTEATDTAPQTAK